MSASIATRDLAFEPVDNARLANFVGPMDENLRQDEGRLRVQVRGDGWRVGVFGAEGGGVRAGYALRQLFELSASGALAPDRVDLVGLRATVEDAGVGVACA